MQLINDNELYHHGILGMKWGVRRYQNPDGSLTSVGKRRYTNKDGTLNKKGQKYLQRQADIKKDEDVKYRGTLTKDELQDRINRLQMEKQLKDITENELHKGRKIVRSILEDAGTRVAKTALSGAVLYAIEKAGTKEFNKKELRKYMANGGPKKK